MLRGLRLLRSLSRAASPLQPHAPPPCAVAQLLPAPRSLASLTAPRSLLPAAAAGAAAALPGALHARPISVVVDNNNLDKAMRVLKRKMIESGNLREIKERTVFVKPSQERVRVPLRINPMLPANALPPPLLTRRPGGGEEGLRKATVEAGAED